MTRVCGKCWNATRIWIRASIYDTLAIEDVRTAAGLLRSAYQESGGADGFVSLEPPPQLTRDTAGTVTEARRLWHAVNVPNLMIKVVASREGIPAIEQLIGEGINVNITLMFSQRHYEEVAQAYLRGLARCRQPGNIASVASFFVSRIDTVVDRALEANGSAEALALRGKIAIANAKVAYRRFREIFHGEAFAALRQRGAHPQRVLWASTGVKNPDTAMFSMSKSLLGRKPSTPFPRTRSKPFDNTDTSGAQLCSKMSKRRTSSCEDCDLSRSIWMI